MIVQALYGASMALLWLLAIFVPLEWAAPRWTAQRRLRPGLATDLAFFAGQHLVFGALVTGALSWLFGLLPSFAALDALHSAFAGWPLALRVVIVIALGDLCMYWGHRLQHANPLLWRFHAIHHTAEQLDFVAAHREHPIDTVYTQFLMNVPAVLLGLSYEGLLGLVAFRGLWATFIHSNVKLPLGPLAYLLGSPQLHHLHHLRQRDIGNYANLAPYLDVLFGTHRSGDDHDEALDDLGLDEPAPKTYLALLAWPFWRH